MLDVLAANPAIDVLEPRGLSAGGRRPHDRAPRSARARPAFTAACARVTGGNPFLLGELLRELARRRADRAPTPPLVARQTSRTVSRAALARLRRLPPEATALARAVVILGDGAEPALAAALAGPRRRHRQPRRRRPRTGRDPDSSRARRVRPLAHSRPRRAGGGSRSSIRSCASPSMRSCPRASGRAGTRARRSARAAGADAERVAIHRHEGDPAGDPRRCGCCARPRRARGGAERPRSRSATCGARCSSRRRPRRATCGASSARPSCRPARYDAAAEHLAAAGDDPHVAAELGAALQLANRPEEAVAALTRAIDGLADDRARARPAAAGHARRGVAGQPRGGGARARGRAFASPRRRRPARPASGCSSPGSPTARR